MALKDKDIDKYIREVEETFNSMVDKNPDIVQKVGEEFTLLYLYSRELVKYSGRLGCWTIVIAILTFILTVTTAINVWLYFA